MPSRSRELRSALGLAATNVAAKNHCGLKRSAELVADQWPERAPHAHRLGYIWSKAAEFASPAKRGVIVELAARRSIPLPEIGADLADGISVSTVCREQCVAVTLDPTEAELIALATDNWTIVKPIAEAVAAALADKE
jgi:hypothetical protein